MDNFALPVINTQRTDMNFAIGRLKKLKNYEELPFANKLPYIIDLMLENIYKENIQKIYLFGSYAYGKPDEDSDLDFCVIIDNDALPKRRDVAFKIKKNLFSAEMIPNDVLVYNYDVFYGHKNPQGIENTIITKGKLLYERK